MKKNKLLYIIIISVSILAIIILYNLYFRNTLSITVDITNFTTSKINGLKITSKALDKDAEVSEIPEQREYKMIIATAKNFDECNVVMYYYDKNGNKHEICLVGYIEKGYSGTVKVNINSIDSNGVLTITINN